jgi:hypothetical protein
MTAEELMRQGGQYARLAQRAETEKERAEWRKLLASCVQESRKVFHPDSWVTKELEALLHEVNTLPDLEPTENGREATEGLLLREDRSGQ